MPNEEQKKSGFQIEDPPRLGLPQSTLHAESVVSFDPPVVQVGVGESFSLDAIVETGGNRVSGAELYVQFDPASVSLEQISASSVFSLSLQSPVIDNARGVGSIALGVPLEQPTVTGKQPIASFRFRTLKPVSDSEIVFSERSLIAADDEPGNVIREMRSARVSITAQ